MTERGGVLLQFGRPSIDTALAASLLRLLILLVLVAATVWLWSTLRRTNSRSGDAQ